LTFVFKKILALESQVISQRVEIWLRAGAIWWIMRVRDGNTRLSGMARWDKNNGGMRD